MFNIKNQFIKNSLCIYAFTLFLSSCSSMNVTEETVYDGGVQTVEALAIKDADQLIWDKL